MGFFLACEDASRLNWSFDLPSSQVKGACRSAMIELAPSGLSGKWIKEATRLGSLCSSLRRFSGK
jgi:hypothetical protein